MEQINKYKHLACGFANGTVTVSTEAFVSSEGMDVGSWLSFRIRLGFYNDAPIQILGPLQFVVAGCLGGVSVAFWWCLTYVLVVSLLCLGCFSVMFGGVSVMFWHRFGHGLLVC